MTASEKFASHALSLQWRDLPDAVRAATKIFLLDTLAAGVAGVHATYAQEVMATESAGSMGAARILGRAPKRAPRAAAFVNAYQIHAQEFDCVHEPAVLHPFSAVTGALAAECSANGPVHGEVFGAALVAGVDIAVSLGLAARSPLKFFRPATAGIFGATAAVARVRGLSQAQTVAALGHALAFVSGTMQAHLEGTPGLALQVGAAARNAIAAADLAQAGVPGAAAAIDGPFGYLSLFETLHDLPPILAELGRSFAVTGLSIKPFPTGRAGHGGIGAVQTLMRDHGLAAADIAEMRYEAPSLIARLVGRPSHAGMRVAYARLCLPYLAARTVFYSTAGLDAFSPDALAEERVLDLASRITVTVDDNPDVAAFTPACLHATLQDGRVVQLHVPALLGSPAAPLDTQARLGKIRACLAFGGVPLGAETLAAKVEVFDHLHDIGELIALTCPSA